MMFHPPVPLFAHLLQLLAKKSKLRVNLCVCWKKTVLMTNFVPIFAMVHRYGNEINMLVMKEFAYLLSLLLEWQDRRHVR